MHCSDLNQIIYLVITTEVDNKHAHKIANALLENELIPCVTFKNVESSFWWEGEIKLSNEVQLIIKCREKNIDKVFNKILENQYIFMQS